MDLSELVSMLKNAECAKDIDRKREEIGELVPAVKVMFDYDQQNYMHRFDLWMHSLHTAVNLPRNLEDDMLYLAAPDVEANGRRTGIRTITGIRKRAWKSSIRSLFRIWIGKDIKFHAWM